MKVSTHKILIIILSLSFIQGCTGYRIKAHDRYEGYKDKKLRVYVRFDFNTEGFIIENHNELSDDELLMVLAVRRAKLLVNAGSTVAGASLSVELLEGEFIYKKCTDDYCEAFIDFPQK